jgi:predicted neuraminidase
MWQYDGRSGVWASVCNNPDGDEPVWSAPKRIWHGVTLNKPTVRSDGAWLLPISLNCLGIRNSGLGPFRGAFQNLDPYRGAHVFVSRDQGVTWKSQSRVVFPYPDWDEHMFVELKDGRLWMVARTDKGPMQAFSSDGGQTWSQPSVPSGFSNPAARFFIRRLSSGRILIVKNGDSIMANGERNKLSAWLSEDEGETWQGGLILDERDGVSYPDGFQSPDGTIYISYDRNRSTDGEILMARFTEEDVLSASPQSPRFKLKMLINKTSSAGGLPKS